MISYQPSPAQPTSLAAQVPPSCRTSLVDRMADDMREMAFADQNVSAESLAERGWSATSIKRLAPDAVARARRQSVRRVA